MYECQLAGPIKSNRSSVTFRSVFQNLVTFNVGIIGPGYPKPYTLLVSVMCQWQQNSSYIFLYIRAVAYTALKRLPLFSALSLQTPDTLILSRNKYGNISP